MKTITSLATLFALTLPVYAQNPTLNQWYRIEGNIVAWGCKDWKDTARYWHLNSKDKPAAQLYIDRAQKNGTCVKFTPGQVVELENYKIMNEDTTKPWFANNVVWYQLRPKGSPDSYAVISWRSAPSKFELAPWQDGPQPQPKNQKENPA